MYLTITLELNLVVNEEYNLEQYVKQQINSLTIAVRNSSKTYGLRRRTKIEQVESKSDA